MVPCAFELMNVYIYTVYTYTYHLFLQAMTSVAVANSFHFATDGGESKSLNDFPIVSIVVSLKVALIKDLIIFQNMNLLSCANFYCMFRES